MYQPLSLTSSMLKFSHKKSPHGWYPCGSCVAIMEELCKMRDNATSLLRIIDIHFL